MTSTSQRDNNPSAFGEQHFVILVPSFGACKRQCQSLWHLTSRLIDPQAMVLNAFQLCGYFVVQSIQIELNTCEKFNRIVTIFKLINNKKLNANDHWNCHALQIDRLDQIFRLNDHLHFHVEFMMLWRVTCANESIIATDDQVSFEWGMKDRFVEISKSTLICCGMNVARGHSRLGGWSMTFLSNRKAR